MKLTDDEQMEIVEARDADHLIEIVQNLIDKYIDRSVEFIDKPCSSCHGDGGWMDHGGTWEDCRSCEGYGYE